jgi:hypothetical protein
MSDIKKLLDKLSEMATTSGAVASVSVPLGATQTRSKNKTGVYSEQKDAEETTKETAESCEAESETVNNVKMPSNFGLWQNSYHQASAQKKRNSAKKSVKESRKSQEHNSLDTPEMQAALKRMKARYHADPRTQDQEKFRKDVERRLQATQDKKTKKVDEYGASPGARRPLKLAEQNLEEADFILNPFERNRRKTRDIFAKTQKQDHEISMARSDLLQCAKNSEKITELLSTMSDNDNLQAWVQEKITKATDYLNTVREYLEGEQSKYSEGYTAGQPALQREGEDLSWDDPDLVALRKRRPEFRSKTHPELDEPKKTSSRIRAIKRDGYTEFRGIDKEIARQRKLGNLEESDVKDGATPEKQGWNAGFRQVEKTKNPYPAGSAEHDQWADGWNEANSQSDYYNESKKPSLKNPSDNPCWKGYKPVGTKKKNGRTVPNCVPKESIEEGSDDIRSARVGDEITLRNKNYGGVIVKIDGSNISFKNESDGKRYKATLNMIDRNLSQEQRYKEKSDVENKRFDDALAGDMKRIDKSGALKKFGIGVAESRDDSPVARAIINRIMMARTDLLEKYGPTSVTQAIDDVADWVGMVDEIGTSDVSGWVREVESYLRDNFPDDIQSSANKLEKQQKPNREESNYMSEDAVTKLIPYTPEEIRRYNRWAERNGQSDYNPQHLFRGSVGDKMMFVGKSTPIPVEVIGLNQSNPTAVTIKTLDGTNTEHDLDWINYKNQVQLRPMAPEEMTSYTKQNQRAVFESYDGDPDEYFVLRHRSQRDIEKEITVPRLWSKVKQFDGFQEAKRARDEMSAKHPGERFTVTTHKKPGVAEATGDRPFDSMMKKVTKAPTAKERNAERIRQKAERQEDSRKRSADVFGTSPADKLSIRKAPGVAEGLSPQQKKAHQANLDAAQREMDRREAEGEDMTGATIDKKTYEIIKPKQSSVKEEVDNQSGMEQKLKRAKNRMNAYSSSSPLKDKTKTRDEIRDLEKRLKK